MFKFRLRLILISASLCAGIALGACTAHKQPETEPAAAPIRLVVSPVRRASVSQMLSLTGTVAALPDHSINVSPAIQGKVAKLYVVPGQFVQKGQLLARLDSAQISDQVRQAQAQVDAAEAAEDQAEISLKLAQSNEQRMKRLVAADIGAQKDLDAAVSQAATAREQLNAAHAKFAELKAAAASSFSQLSYTAVRAPIAGIVAARMVNDSEPSGPQTPLLQLVDLSVVLVNALLPPSLPASVRPGLPAIVTTSALPHESFTGFVKLISPVVDAQSQFIPVQVECSNPGLQLKQGQPVAVAIAEKTNSNALVVPDTALVADPDNINGRMVYVYDKNTKEVKRIRVLTGIKQGSLTEIVWGVHDGELIVVAGAYGLPDGTKIEAQIAQVYEHTSTAIQSH